MRIRLLHPVWRHLPSVTALIILIIYIFASGPLPAEVPVHFGLSGEPDRYGSPWLSFGLTVGLSFFFIALSVFVDELWARQEKSKTFNWLSLLDDIVVGVMVGIDIGYLRFISSGNETFSFPLGWLFLVGGSATVLAVILELFRPYRYNPAQPAVLESETLEAELAERLKSNAAFIYWDFQNPVYVTILTTLLPLVFLIAAVLTFLSQPWLSLIIFIPGLLLIIPHGGQRTLVTRQDITIRWGIMGLKVLRLTTAEIAGAGLHEFAPLKDFGGYGIRFNREMKAYYLRGTRGVLLTTTGGKKYLVGSDHPERLLAVIQAVGGNA